MSFSKNKEKRSRSSSSESNNSFVKNVTSRMSGLLPATITKWFSSPSSSNTNGSAQTAEATDSSTEDEAPESPTTMQPAPKRMRYSSPGKFNYYTPAEPNDTLEQCSSYTAVPTSSGRNTFNREKNFVVTSYRAASVESSPDVNTDNSFKSQLSVSNIGPSVATKRKSLFDSLANTEETKKACAKTACNTRRDPSQPCFKPSLLGSPFYSGRTMYGGAATSYINRPNIKERRNTLINEPSKADNSISHSARRIMDLLEHYSSPLSEAKRIPVVSMKKESWQNSSTSDLVKKPSYKTQELLVPSIASILRVKRHSRLMDTTNAARQIIASHSSTMHELSSPYCSPSKAVDNNKFTTKVKSKLSKVTRSTSDIETSMPEPVDLPDAVLQIDQNNLPRFSLDTPTSKTSTSSTSTLIVPPFKTKLSNKTVETKITPIVETVSRNSEPVESISNPFKFSSPVSVAEDRHTQSVRTPPKYTFGSPERSVDKTKSDQTKNDESSCVIGGPKENEYKLTIVKSKDWQCPSCWVSNKPDVDQCVCCNEKRPSKDNKTKSSDKPISEKSTKFDSFKPLEIGKSSKWNCDDCWVSNDASADKCVCCGASNPKKSSKNADSVKSQPLLKKSDSSKWSCKDCWVSNDASEDKCVCCGAANPDKPNDNCVDGQPLSKKLESSNWSCKDCWVSNTASVDKCVCCGGLNPSISNNKSESTASNTNKEKATTSSGGWFSSQPKDSTFKAIIAAQSSKWECPDCSVRNDNDKTRCSCCDSERPGTNAKTSDKKSFTFGAVPTFKFGLSAQTQEAAKPAEVKALSDFNKSTQESETNNNILPKTPPTFSFGLPSKESVDVIKKSPEKSANMPKFSFGMPNSSPLSAPSGALIFGNIKPIQPTAKVVPEEDEKPQEVPKIVFSAPEPQISLAPVSSLFASPLPKPAEKSASPSLLSSVVPVKKNETTPNTLTLPAPVPANDVAARPAFTLSVKPAASMFATPAAPATTNVSFGNIMAPPPYTASSSSPISFTNPLQSTPTTTTSLFQTPKPAVTTSATPLFPSNPSTTTAGSLFQAPSSATTTSSSAFVSSTPVFNFGSSNQTPEKPSFNLSFGSNNKTASPFKPTFNAPTEIKFSLNTGVNSATNGLPSTMGGGGSGISTVNPLGGGNGIAMNNSLGSNIMSPGTNNLTTNALGSSNPLASGNGLPPQTGGIFGSTPAVQKENMWSTSNNNSANMFGSEPAAAPQKPAAFTFGSSSAMASFGANNNVFGNSAPSAPVFGMASQSGSSAPLFASPAPSQPTGVFGATSPVAPSVGLFSTPTPSVGATPSFGTPSQPATFEAPSLTAGSAPAFNFGSSVPQAATFGFGQDNQQPQQPGAVYNFGSAAGTPQFSIGNAAVAQRRIRRAHRRIR